MSEANDLVIVHHGTSPGEAEVVLTLLKDTGVAAVIPDSNNPFPGVDMTPFGDPGGVGCDVYAPQADAERARTIIEQARGEAASDSDE